MNFRLSVACICLAALLAINVVDGKSVLETQPKLRDITVVQDIRDFARNHPGLKLTRLSKEPGRTRSQSVRYTLGGRVAGDRLVAQGSDVFNYPAKKDVAIQLTYPESGTGSIVTFVDLVCQQDSDSGNAYVIAGGIGQRYISIVVEANQTEQFSYNAQYYGSN
ncbi:uncharacterized protein LOC119672383 [Teleopsis dalmanni]|uniref:uncharacterized protein LOC119672189 n=1 Tax=Teleopsis dalmanni TaxID=139649 RepID=UPI000D32D180|nr:uncharacterized protein LOC119672189 [Teleopsis dalmanni]XP_037939346.1 uncharacterized protein LOC119672383 [Teleopsis dalmanni]